MNAKQANRAARRKEARETPRYLRGTKEEKMRRLLQNGITPQMLEEEFRRGYDAGSTDGINHTFKTIYAAVMLAAGDTYHFGKKRTVRLLRRVDELATTALSSADAIDEVWERFGVALEFNEVFDRVVETEEGGAGNERKQQAETG